MNVNSSTSRRPFIDVDTIPSVLKECPQWVVYIIEHRKGKQTKVPYRADDASTHASVTNPNSWTTFERALKRCRETTYSSVDGLGFVFTENDSFCGIDLDNCRDPETGEIKPWAQRIIDMLSSYSEISPSGTGVKIFVRGKLQDGAGKKCQVDVNGRRWRKDSGFAHDGDIEIYDRKRYFTVTSNHLVGTPLTIEPRGEEVLALRNELFGKESPKKAESREDHSDSKDTSDSDNCGDDEILAKALSAKNSGQLEKFLLGDITADDYPNEAGTEIDQSRADLAFCCRIAWWTGDDPDRIFRIVKRSPLYRDKWERVDYRERTIRRAIEFHQGTFYDPLYHSRDAAGELKPKEDADDPHRLTSVVIDHHRIDEINTLAFYREESFRWEKGAYRTIPKDEFRGTVIDSIKKEFNRLNLVELKAYDPAKDTKGKGPPSCRKVTRNLTTNVMDALASQIIIPGGIEQPTWLGKERFPYDFRECLIAPMAIIHLPSFIAGKSEYFLPTTPLLFATTCLGCDFVPDAAEPKQFLAFLRTMWEEDEEAIQTIQEWFGYVLTSDTSLQKLLFLVGPKRSGKGTLARILVALLNKMNVAGPTLSSFATNFGLWALLNKSLAIVSDARLSGRTDTAIITERLLSITGEDAITVDRKNLSPVTARLPTRLMILSNEIPRISDASGALASRMIVLTMNKSWLGREDTKLEAKLLAELPGILLWAIIGWKRLQERGYFVQPRSSRQSIQVLEDLSSPIKAFVRECCVVGPGKSVAVKDLYAAWLRWCLNQGKEDSGDSPSFGRDLKAAVSGVGVTQPRLPDGTRHRVYQGLALSQTRVESEQDEDENDHTWHVMERDPDHSNACEKLS